MTLWDESFQNKLKSYPVKRCNLSAGGTGVLSAECPPIRSAMLGESRILVGTRNAEVLEINKDGSIEILVQVSNACLTLYFRSVLM